MYEFYLVTGILILTFFSLAAINGLKPFVKLGIINKLSKHHKIFGMLATATAFIHMGYALSQGDLRITGTLTLLSLMSTGLFGMLFATQKKKWMYVVHRVMGPLTMVFAIIHIVLNSTT